MSSKAGIQDVIIDESIWIPASAGMTKNAIQPRFTKRGILADLRKSRPFHIVGISREAKMEDE